MPIDAFDRRTKRDLDLPVEPENNLVLGAL